MNQYVIKLFGGLDGLNKQYYEEEQPIEQIKKTNNKEYQRLWKAKNKEHVKEYYKKYYKEHKEVMKNNQKRRYEKVKDDLDFKQGQHEYYIFKRYT
jgi:hypothetical protein